VKRREEKMRKGRHRRPMIALKKGRAWKEKENGTKK
jgi:hypothetical protein